MQMPSNRAILAMALACALIALPAIPTAERRPVFRFAEWLPRETPWQEIG